VLDNAPISHDSGKQVVRMSIETGTTSAVQLSREQLDALIDREARGRLQMSGSEFKRKYKAGKLADSPTVRDIAMLLKLAR